jgi:hypothetical protein
MHLYRTGAWCALNPPVAVGKFCALFPEMNVALQTCSDTSIRLPQGSQPTLQTPLLEEARLRLLRQHDKTRPWTSVRERRVCMLCGNEFEGAQIRIGVRAGKPVFGCPEALCRGSLPHFAASGNPLLDEAAWSDWMRPPADETPATLEDEACSF